MESGYFLKLVFWTEVDFIKNGGKIHTAKTKDMFSMIKPSTSEEELKAAHMFISASVTAGKKGVMSARFLLARKCWLKPQIARTALIRTIAGLSAASPDTVASINRVMAGAEIWAGNLEPIHKHRPSKNGDAGLLTSFNTTFSKKPEIGLFLPLLLYSFFLYKKNHRS